MKINEFVTESTTSGAIATVATPMTTQSRNASIYGSKKGGNLLTGKKTNKKYANSVNESVPLKFHTIKLTKENITGYSISVFEAYNINKHNQTYKSLLYGMLNNRRPLVESMEKSNIDHLTNTIDRLNSKKEIKVGDMFSVLLFIINPIYEHVEVLGFTKPKEVKEIKRRNDGTIDFIRFTDMDRYPRAPIAAVGKHHAQHPAYFNSEQEADNALLMLKLTLPETWEMDLDSVNDPNYRSGLSEKNMKISEINEPLLPKPVNESKMKQLAMDLKDMDNGNFQKKYKKSKEQMKMALGDPHAKKTVQEADLQEDDLILVPGQGHKLKSGFIPHDQDRRDHEVEMARSDLFQAAKNAKQIYEIIENVSEDEGLEGWVQEKIIKANDYLNTVREYLEHKQVQEMTGGVIAGGGVGEGIGDKIKGAVRRMKDKEHPLQTRRDVAMTKGGAAYNRGETRKGDQYMAYAEKDRKKKGDPTTNPAGTYRTKTTDYTNEGAMTTKPVRGEKPFKPSMDRPKGEWDPIHGKAPRKGTLAYDSWKQKVAADLKEAQSLGGALKNSLAKAEPGSKLDNSIKAHNRDIKNGGKGTLKNAPTGYHFDKKGYCRLGDK